MGNFHTDTIRNDPCFHLPKRVSDLQMLEPGTRQRVQRIIEDARAHGLELMAWETFRSKARQLALCERGASRLRDVGVHNYGLACDIVKAVDGDPSWKGSFDLLGTLAREHGLIWGGDWGEPTRKHDFVDLVHVQRCTVARQAALFRGDWYPDDDYDRGSPRPHLAARARPAGRALPSCPNVGVGGILVAPGRPDHAEQARKQDTQGGKHSLVAHRA